MKVGMMVYATDTGLGNQTRLLHRLLRPAKTMLVDLSAHNYMPVHLDWYEQIDVKTTGVPNSDQIGGFLDGLDAVFVCETPLDYYLLSRAKKLGVKTIVQVNPEFLDLFAYPNLPRPDMFALPTPWMEKEVRAIGVPTQLLRVPVDLSQLPQRSITEAKTFFHIAGRPAHLDRNGTLDFIAAAKIARRQAPGARFTLYCQAPTKVITQALIGSPVDLVPHVDKPAELYRQGDVMVMPRKYGGLCLPLQEALGSGIPTLMTRISPNTELLPDSWLLPVLPSPMRFKTRGMVEAYSVHVPSLARKMVQLYRQPETVRQMHEEAKALGKELSWNNMRSKYMELIEEVVR